MNPIIESLKVIIELLRTGFTKVSISAELDDPNIASIKTNTDTIKSDVTAIKTSISGNKTNTDTIVTLLTQINSKMKTILVVTQAEYDLIDPKDPNTIYLITQDTQP